VGAQYPSYRDKVNTENCQLWQHPRMPSLYRRYILPPLLDRAMSDRRISRYRRPVLAPASGRILEIGFGTGANLSHYPESVQQLEIVEPDAALNVRARRRLEKSSRDVIVHALSAEQLPFDAASFDTVVSTFTLCSIPDVESALREVHRVLKPGGQFLFLEHGLSPESSVAGWQHRLTPIQKVIGGGCHLDRPMRSLIEHTGLNIESAGYEERYAPKLPKVVAWLTSGVAKKSVD
jgi:SAM-dependent methyltransferase